MRLVFDGIETPIETSHIKATTLYIENSVLFGRVCNSLCSGVGRDAEEPYTIWIDGVEKKPNDTLLVIANPFDLPWNDRRLSSALFDRMKGLLFEDEELRGEVEALRQEIDSKLAILEFQLYGDYEFGLEWDLRNYLKAFGFAASHSAQISLFDNLISFVNYVSDLSLNLVLIFVNLRTFLSERELYELQSHIIFLEIESLFLEGLSTQECFANEQVLYIDQDLLESFKSGQSEFPSSTLGRFSSNGFGAVTF